MTSESKREIRRLQREVHSVAQGIASHLVFARTLPIPRTTLSEVCPYVLRASLPHQGLQNHYQDLRGRLDELTSTLQHIEARQVALPTSSLVPDVAMLLAKLTARSFERTSKMRTQVRPEPSPPLLLLAARRLQLNILPRLPLPSPLVLPPYFLRPLRHLPLPRCSVSYYRHRPGCRHHRRRYHAVQRHHCFHPRHRNCAGCFHARRNRSILHLRCSPVFVSPKVHNGNCIPTTSPN
ncbi:hypothetical protein B0H13DRAFT_2537618 [Mycena leptocephala]|nr:hypothetical protein B0H13DRAFT_2537618 [Mycena leptocephala]